MPGKPGKKPTKLDQIIAALEHLRVNQEAFAANQEGFKTNLESFRAELQEFRTNQEEFRTNQEGFKAELQKFRANQEGFRANQDDFRTNQEGFRAELQEFRANQENFGAKQDDFRANQKSLTANQQRFEKRLEALAQDIADFRKENAREHEYDRQKIWELYDSHSRQIGELQKNLTEFRAEILGTMDVVRKEYDITHLERIAVGAAQDRMQETVTALQDSDGRQDQKIAELETRISVLEAGRN